MDTPTTSYVKSPITFSASSLKFYINNFRIFEGSNFYFDYTTEEHCFMYYDISDMKCLKAKEGYSVYQG